MATTFNITVLLPNARRSNVKVSTNNTLLQVLEDVCKKHQLEPHAWDLVHHNKRMDLGVSVRFSGIPNNATLEMKEATSTRVESAVNIALQLENGKRLKHSFGPRETLWDVLQYWSGQGESIFLHEREYSDEGVQPICIYMRQEVVGKEELSQKSLRSLGLTQGGGVIRFLHRTASDLKTQANVSAPLSRPVVVPTPEPKVISQVVEDHAPVQDATMDDSESSKVDIFDSERPLNLSSVPDALPDPEPMDLDDDPKPNKIPPKELQPNKAENRSTAPVPPKIANNFRYSKKGELHILGEHSSILYHSDDISVRDDTSEIEEAFFDLSVDEVKRMYVQLQRKRQDLENVPLQLQSSRELEKNTTQLRMLKDYPETIVRVRFTNRYVLQGIFRTAGLVKLIFDWVRGFLSNPNLDFYLFTAPPKQLLKEDMSLVEEGLVGMAVIYFGSEDPSASSEQRVLREDVYDKVSAPDAVYEHIHQKFKRHVNSETHQEISPEVSPVEKPGSSQTASTLSGSNNLGSSAKRPVQYQNRPGGTGAAPKWFKLGK